ncbi:MAG: DUF1684 domain-containing protein [Gammaproteobacteria bacterium]|nr:DUF1684 domain-containing protein [Gammaproteobacteria bacterium]
MSRVFEQTGILAAALLLAACGRVGADLDLVAYEQEILDWRKGRLERLLAPTGYLNQIGLHWLQPGVYSIGSDAQNDIVVPATAAARIGAFHVGDEGVRLVVEDGVEVQAEGVAVRDFMMPADTTGKGVLVSHGSLAWSVIERGGKLAVRIRDYEHPFVATFGPLPYYDIDPSQRVVATLRKYDEPRTITVNTVIEGFQQFPVSPGVLEFELNGEVHDLEVQSSSDNKLFIVFGDETNRGETYGAGRFVYVDDPGVDGGETILDFNKSYSPPCAFNDFSTCPVASPRNRLATRVTAGEKYDPALHYSGATGH